MNQDFFGAREIAQAVKAVKFSGAMVVLCTRAIIYLYIYISIYIYINIYIYTCNDLWFLFSKYL